MTLDPRLLTKEQLDAIETCIQNYMKEPEQWREMLTERINRLFAHISALEERDRGMRESLQNAKEAECNECNDVTGHTFRCRAISETLTQFPPLS